MLLEIQDGMLFFKLHRALMLFVNQRLRVIPDEPATPDEFSHLAPELRLKVREALLSNPHLIEAFAGENPHNWPNDELDIVRSWCHFVSGKFYCFRQLTKHMIFLSGEESPRAFGVLALSQPFDEMIGPYLPVLIETLLLPFKNRIVYDGLLSSYPITFGAGIRRSLNEVYQEAKKRHGIITSLPMERKPTLHGTISMPVRLSPSRKKLVRQSRPKENVADALRAVLGMVEQFCREHLNQEYADLCCAMAEKLGRKRPSPLARGNPNTWACGIIRTIGWVNYLDDRSQKPHMKMADIDKAFGVGTSTGQGKSMLIRKMLKISQFSFEWILPSRQEDHPLTWMLSVNGFLMDIRDAPREAQEVAFEQGLIPYIPADREEE